MPKAREMTPDAPFDGYALPIATEPMEAKSATDLPAEGDWQFEPKWDGFRCLIFKDGQNVDLRAKSGKPLGRYFPEVATFFQSVKADQFVVDGELVIEIDGHLAFDALQIRLHPAESRIRKLSTEAPARFVMFDILAVPNGDVVTGQSLFQRRPLLEHFAGALKAPKQAQLSPMTRDLDLAKTWLADSGPNGTDGVIAKPLAEPYLFGERAMRKVKRLRTADCVVGGFRYESDSDKVGSLLLGLFNDAGKLDHVGFTSTITNEERLRLTKKLERLRAPPGFTGKAPGGPSRWSTARSGEWQPLKPELVVEVRFDHVTGQRFRHGTKLIRWRPDKRPDQCTLEQIEP
jgi:ATP-dependent DNA ligase